MPNRAQKSKQVAAFEKKSPPPANPKPSEQLAKLEEGLANVENSERDGEQENGVPIRRNGEMFHRRRVPGCKGFMFIRDDMSIRNSWVELRTRDKFEEFVFYEFIEGGQGWFSKYFPPVIARQFYAKDTLFLERKFRKVTWDELFVDLIFVAVVRQCAHIIEYDSFAASSILQFLLVFPAIHHTWMMIHELINTFNFEFILCRVYLFVMIILVYGMGLNCYNAFDFISVGAQNTTNIFIISFLIFRILYTAYYLLASIYMVQFRLFIFVQLGIKFIGLSLICASIFMQSGIKLSLYAAGYVWDFFGYDFIFPLLKMAFKWKKPTYRLAMNIEHNTERLGNFTLIMLGEMVIALLWSSSDSNFNVAYVGTIMGLLIVVVFQSIVFSLDIVHMLRQSVYISMGVHALTLGFHICLVACSAALDDLAVRSSGLNPDDSTHPVDPNEPPEFNSRWIFCTGAAGALIFQTCKTSMEHHDPLSWALRYRDRLIVRSISAVSILIVAGVGITLSPVNLISSVSGILLFTLIVDGSLARWLHSEHEAEQLGSMQSAALGKNLGDGSSVVSRGDGIMEG